VQSDQQQKLSQLLADSFSAVLSDLEDTQILMEMDEWDSLSHMQFITTLEGEFGFELTGDEIADMQTIGDVKKIIEARSVPTS
jgi:acyl carrier protein